MMTARNRHCLRLLAVITCLVSTVSCATLQQDKLNQTVDAALETDLARLRELIVPLDRNADPLQMSLIRERIKEMESRNIQDSQYQAQLLAWSGRLFLLEGKRAEAERRLAQAERLSPAESASFVLAARLEPDSTKRLAQLIQSAARAEEPALLDIERARTLASLSRYQEAVAAFDSAFSRLPSVFRTTYGEEREMAWQLKDVSGTTDAKTAEILAKNVISWRDAIELTRTETSLLQFITGGDRWTPERLETALRERKILPSAQTGYTALDDPMPRRGAAWFIWHLHAAWKSRPALTTRYSDRFRPVPGAKSPISDVAIQDPWFDSVMGCVEWEFMALSDGRNFNPEGTLGGSAFRTMILRVK